ncbi:class I SAM-dependent RNA methyltransferase [Stomatohabitans albus]|uniref:class I SAM-dependent RNA methyltransferase n=1 Tax=Stomatohabitans albus TaxID=3110766 RepID=UPI00300CD34E
MTNADIQDIEITGWTHGGEGVGHLNDGRAVFVAGTIPGETVRADVTVKQKRFARANLVDVLESSPHRVAPACTCPGCVLSYIDPNHQLALKRRTIIEQVERIGHIADPPVDQPVTPTAWPTGYRATARVVLTDDGRIGFSANKSHEIVPIDRCVTFTPSLLRLVETMDGHWAGAEMLRLLATDTEHLVEVYPGEGGLPSAPDGDYTYAIVTVGEPAIMRGSGHVTMPISPSSVPPFALQVSAGSFFQSGPSPAATLVDVVLEAAQVQPDDDVVDLYAGVGLFTLPLARLARHVTSVESSQTATDDAVANLADTSVTVYHDDCTDWLKNGYCPPGAVVVLDPPRSGAGDETIQLLAATSPQRVVHVACDVAALARDLASWVKAGYHLERITPVDMFAHTAHIEAVATLTLGE